MAKLEDIMAQLQAVVPKYTDYFTDTVGISTIANVSGTTYQITTDSAHGLTTGNYVTIQDSLVRNNITAIADLGDNIVKLTTNVYHDLTQSFNLITGDNHTVQVYLANFGNLSDGFYNLLTVPTGNQFTVSLPSVPTGSGYLGENRIGGVNGRYQTTVIDTTNFTIVVPDGTFTNFVISGSEKVIVKSRISGTGNPDSVVGYYTKKSIGDYWAVVVAGNSTASFNRKIESDAVNRFEKADDYRQEIIEPFTLFVFVPTTNVLNSRAASDSMKEIRMALCKSLIGVIFDSGFQGTKFLTSYIGDGFFDYVGAYYIHQFNFETVYNMMIDDGVDPTDTKAFRTFEVDYALEFDEYDETKKTIEGELP